VVFVLPYFFLRENEMMKPGFAVAGFFGLLLVVAGCSSPLKLPAVPTVPKKIPGSQAVGNTADYLFGSTVAPKKTKVVPQKAPPQKALDDDFDFAELTDKTRKKPQEPPSKESNNIESVNPETEKLRNLLSKDTWVANAELRTWLEKQAESDDIPSVQSLTASPGDPNRKAKTNFYDQLNAPAGSKIQRGDYTFRDSADAVLGPISLYRWYHGPIEDATNKLLDPQQTTPDELNRVKYQAAQILTNSPPKSVAAANAAIFLARLEVEETKPFLLDAVKNSNFSVTLRCAAAEALAGCRETKNGDIAQLYALYAERNIESDLTQAEKNKSQSGFTPGVPDLAVELLQSLAERISPVEDPVFTAALKSRLPSVRLAAVKIWRDNPPGENPSGDFRQACPDELLNLISDPVNPQIRVAAMIAAARWNHPRALHYLQNGVEDVQLTVRLAAVRALGILGGPDAVRVLKEHVHDQSPKMRSQVAASLRKLGEKETLFRLADDKAFEVRSEVAKGLDNPKANRTGELAKKMLADPSARVQKNAIEAIGQWPLELAAPILFGEMESRSLLKRETATKMLARQWEPAATFPYDDRQPEVLAKSLAILKDRFESDDQIVQADNRVSDSPEYGMIQQAAWKQARELDRLSLEKGRKAIAAYTNINATREERTQAREQMISLREKFPLVVEYLQFTEKQLIPQEIYASILPQTDTVFRSLEQLESGAVPQRRRAADEILERARLNPLGPLVVSRLCETGLSEEDTLTRIVLFQIFEMSPGELADRFAIESLGSDTPEIRRRACDLLGQSEELAALRYLLPMVNDTATEVVRTTLVSVGSLAPLYFEDVDEEEFDPTDTQLITDPIRSILLRSEASLQIAASVALVQWNDPTGMEAIRRLSFAGDDKTRLALAQAVGPLYKPQLADVLIRLLDDKRGSVRQAALNSLPKLVGTDYGNPMGKISVPLPDQTEAWKAWQMTNDK